MEISQPTFHKDTRSHKVSVLQYSSTLPVITSSCQESNVSPPDISGEDIRLVLSEFLTKASAYFSRKLDVQTFLSRTKFVWAMDLPEIPATGAFRIVWVPESFLFHANANYESIWKAHSVLPGEVQPASEASPPVSEVLEGAELIPLDQTSPPIVPTNRRAERQKVREARLRAALAHVRAERLAAKYYQKYGQYQPADDESSLSVESEFEDELEDFRKI